MTPPRGSRGHETPSLPTPPVEVEVTRLHSSTPVEVEVTRLHSSTPVEVEVTRLHLLPLLLLLTLLFIPTTHATPSAPPDFPIRILPILTKAGCNGGACHGAATGQGGFKLSLLGYAPDLDHSAITRELGARRLDFSQPAQSLLLRKATDQLDHEGGRRLKPGSPEVSLLEEWIAQGAPMGRADLSVTRLDVQPALLQPSPSTNAQSITVTAHLSDGSSSDVSALALYSSNDDSVADVDRLGRVRLIGPGTTAIMIRFAGAVAAIPVQHPHPTPVDPAAFARFNPRNEIDPFILQRLRDMNIPPSPPAEPHEFLRRLHIDLTGQLPDPALIDRFLRKDSPEARDALVDELLASDAFTDLWSMHLADLLLISGKRGGPIATRTHHHWLRQQVATNAPWDRITRHLLTASGSVNEIGPASFSLLANDPRDFAEHVASIFLAARIGCARCHAHPADRWTRTDYHRFAAFFARIQRDNGRIESAPHGEVEDPHSGLPLPPRPLGDRTDIPANIDRRIALADWVVSPENPLFARAFVNRVWRHLMGRGLVEPVDDLRPTHPATHPELLDALARDFISHRFNLRRLIRSIVTSATYQLSSRPLPGNATDDRLYSHARLKSPDGRVLLDLIAQATGVPETFKDQPEAQRAVQLIGSQSPSVALDILGRCSRDTSCEAIGVAGGGLAQSLHLINGTTLNSRLNRGHLPAWLQSEPDDASLVTRLYLHTLSRPPTPAELQLWTQRFNRSDPPASPLSPTRTLLAEDLLWALLNSREFNFIH